MCNQLCKWLIFKLSTDAHVYVYKHIWGVLISADFAESANLS